jgi:hypothetical protein
MDDLGRNEEDGSRASEVEEGIRVENQSDDDDPQDEVHDIPILEQVLIQQELPKFLLTPTTSIGEIIDYLSARGRKLYSTVTSKLEDELFNCSAEDLYLFLKALKDRAREYGWDEPGVGIFRSLTIQWTQRNLNL